MTRKLAAVSVALLLSMGAFGVAGAGAAPVSPQPDAYRDEPPLAYVSKGRVFVLDGKGSPPLRMRGATAACCVAFSPDGYYVAFQQGGDLWVAEHDGSELHRVARSVARWAWAPDGQALAVIPKPARDGSGGTGIDVYGAKDSKVRDTQLPNHRVLDLAWAGLGRRLAVTAVPTGASAGAELFMLEVPGPYGDDCPALCPEEPVRIPIDHPENSSGPLFAGWSPSVDAIAVWTAPDNGATLGLVSPRGGGITPLAQTLVRRSWVQWSRGGDRLLVVEGHARDAGAPRALLLCTITTSCRSIAGGNEPIADPAWSRAGPMAYVRAENRQLWIANRDGADARQLTAAGEGVASPRWLPDSHHLVFVRDGKVWLLDVTGGDPVPVADRLGPGAMAEQLYSVAP